jgi:hypothetical protein
VTGVSASAENIELCAVEAESGEKVLLILVIPDESDTLSRVRIDVVLSGGRFMGVRDIDLVNPGAFEGGAGRGSVFMTPGLNSGGVWYAG